MVAMSSTRACASFLEWQLRSHWVEGNSGGKMSGSILINGLFIFMLAGFIGFEVIRRVSPLLHTPLMSLTNALDAIAVVGAIVLVGEHKSTLSAILGTIAVVAATSNIVGGFLITDRMLKMFKSSRPAAKS
jgi:NAD(P) transhydrogenase subunit alpha